MSTQPLPRPQPNVMWGVTHDAQTGEQIIRVPRTTKVSIGVPAGKDIHVYVARNPETGKAQWCVRANKKNHWAESMGAAKALYDKLEQNAPEKSYPEKLAHFTFRHLDNNLVLRPDFDAIDKHGEMPTVLPIVFTDPNPLDGAYTMWGSGRRKCFGDGRTALRVLDMAANDEERALAEYCRKQGQKHFPIVNGCKLYGCQYALPTKKNGKEYPPACKPQARLSFQLSNWPRLGGKAEFTTTSYRSISQLYSSIEELRGLVFQMTGVDNLRGLPLYLVLRPYQVEHNGQKSKAYSVSVELRSETLLNLRKQLGEYVGEVRAMLPAAPIEGVEATTSPEPEELTPEEAQAIGDEFYPEAPEQDDLPADEETFADEAPPATDSSRAAAATETATEELRKEVTGDKRQAAEVRERVTEQQQRATQQRRNQQRQGRPAEPAPPPEPAHAQTSAPPSGGDGGFF